VNLNELNEKVAPKPVRHRVARGPASGWGTTAGRGNNGAACRSGHKNRWYRQGGQMPFVRRIPKRGFNNKLFAKVWAFVNLHDLNTFNDGDVVTAELCLEKGLIPKVRSGLKVLGVGTLEKKITVKAHRASVTAKAAVEAKGGKIELLTTNEDLATKKAKAKRGTGQTTTRRKAAQAKSAPAAPAKKR
jgi:large subunit ribosomal protein L15